MPVLDTNFLTLGNEWATTWKWNNSLAHEDKPLVQKSLEKKIKRVWDHSSPSYTESILDIDIIK